jgi:hypothetical protein
MEIIFRTETSKPEEDGYYYVLPRDIYGHAAPMHGDILPALVLGGNVYCLNCGLESVKDYRFFGPVPTVQEG